MLKFLLIFIPLFYVDPSHDLVSKIEAPDYVMDIIPIVDYDIASFPMVEEPIPINRCEWIVNVITADNPTFSPSFDYYHLYSWY